MYTYGELIGYSRSAHLACTQINNLLLNDALLMQSKLNNLYSCDFED